MAEDNFLQLKALKEDLDNGNVIEQDIILSEYESPASSHNTPATEPIESVKSNVDHKPGADATEYIKCYVDNEQAVTNEPTESAKSKVDNEPAVANEFTESAKTHDKKPPLPDEAFETAKSTIDKKGKGPKKGKKSKKASTPLGDVIASSSKEPIAQVLPQPIPQVLPQPIAQVLPQLVSTSHTQAKIEEQKKPRNKRNKKKNFTIFSADPRSPLLKDCMILPSIVGQPAEFKGESSKVADSIQDTRVKLVNKLKEMKKQKSKSKVVINLALSKEHSVDGASTSFNTEQPEIKIDKNKKIKGKKNNKLAILQNEPDNINSTHNIKKEGRKDDKALQYILDANKPDDNEPHPNNDGDWSTDFCTEKEEDVCKKEDFTFEKVDEATYSMEERPVHPKIKTFELDDSEILKPTLKKESDSDN